MPCQPADHAALSPVLPHESHASLVPCLPQNHDCTPWDNRVYSLNRRLNDVLITQQGDSGGASYYGNSKGSQIIPITNKRQIQFNLAMGHSRCTNRLTVQVYGYFSGVGILPGAQVRNLRIRDRLVDHKVGPLDPAFVPATAVGVISAITTFVDSRNDHYQMSFGRDNSRKPCWNNCMYSGKPNSYNDLILTHHGDAAVRNHYGMSHGSFMIPMTGGKFSVYNNAGKNNGNNYAFTTMQTIGWVPPYSNVKFLATGDIRRLRLSTQGQRKYTDLGSPTTKIPSNAKALIGNMYTYDNSRNDHVTSSFGRNAGHTTHTWDNQVWDLNTWLNDILITHEGNSAAKYHYGHSHGMQIVPLKSNGKFDAWVKMGSSSSNFHYVNFQVVGWVE